MTDTSSHPEIEQLLPAAALESLEGDELLQVTAHVEECAHCARLLDSYREVVAGLAATLPSHQIDPARSENMRARLLARAGGNAPRASALPPQPLRPTGVSRWGGWAGWAVAAGFAGVLLIHHSVHRPVALGWMVAGILTLLLLALGLRLRRQRRRLQALEDRLASLTGESSRERAELRSSSSAR